MARKNKEDTPKKKRRLFRLRRLLFLGGVGAGIAAWRRSKVAGNEQQFGQPSA